MSALHYRRKTYECDRRGWAAGGGYRISYPGAANPARQGVAWNAKEDADLLAGVQAGYSVGKLAHIHSRTSGAIDMRLERLRGNIPMTRATPLHVVPATPLVKPTPKPAPISTKYTGKHAGFVDLTAGVYWEAMYQLSPDEVRIQQALLKPVPKGAPLAASVRITARIKEYLTKLKGLADSGNIVP